MSGHTDDDLIPEDVLRRRRRKRRTSAWVWWALAFGAAAVGMTAAGAFVAWLVTTTTKG